MSFNRLSDSSVISADYHRLFDETVSSSAEICTWDHPALQQVTSNEPPRFRVFMTRLEPKVQVYADAGLVQPVAYSREVAECLIAEACATEPVAEGLLFDASSVGQVMCLGVGRYPHNRLRPFVGDDPEFYYDHPDDLDPACICGQISRDHGLVFLDTDGKVRYRDFGTRKRGSRRGSKNGTWLNGERRLRDAVIEWKPGDYLGLGGRVWVRRGDDLVKEHVFKLRYEQAE